MGVPIVFDEPSYAMGKREWYEQLNKALVKTVESVRFLVRPLIIPIINMNLLDKTIRNYLIQFQVHVTKRGRAMVYRIYPSQAKDKVYRYLFSVLHYPILNSGCPKATCLGCREAVNCDKFRAKYERKKEYVQLGRYDEGLELAAKLEARELTIPMIVERVYPLREKYLKKGKIDVKLLKHTLYNQLGVRVSHTKAYDLRTWLLETYPDDFK